MPAERRRIVVAALARLGVPSALVTVVPDSPLGHRAVAELASAGVDLRYVRYPLDARLGTYFVERGSGLWPTRVFYDRGASGFATLIEWQAGALLGATYAVVSGITPALSDKARRACIEMLDEAEANGIKVCFDVNYRAKLWSAPVARATMEAIMTRATVVVCPARDASQLFGDAAVDPRRLRESWATRAEICVITRATAGAVGVDANDRLASVQALVAGGGDRPGIGDAFVAGLICGLLERRPLGPALDLARRAAALKASSVGDVSLARRTDLEFPAADQDQTAVLR
jgi:2-dehydro-3-deoxygluconokinase